MNWKKLIYPQPENFTAERVRSQAKIYLFLMSSLLVLFLLSSINSYYYGDKVLRLKVSAFNTPQNLYKYVEFSFGNYTTGIEGTLSYKATSFIDFLVLQNIGGSTIIDFVFLFVIGLILYKSVSKIDETNPFSEKISKSFTLILVLGFALYVLEDLYFLAVASPLFAYRTNRVFELQQVKGNSFVFFLMFFGLTVYFLRQGNRLQQEQELTV
jgi:hypothetical protein